MIKKVKPTSMKLIAELITPVLESGRSVKFTVVGSSMYPIFHNNRDCVTMSPFKKIHRLDIILYQRDSGEYVLHRVMGKGKEGLKLCGDNQMYIEYPVKKENVIAVMTSFERNGKRYTRYSPIYVIYSVFWCMSLKLRPFLLNVIRFLKKFNNSKTFG